MDIDPHMRLNEVVGNAMAIAIHKAEVVLGTGVTLLCCPAILMNRLSVVLGHALAILVHSAEVVLGIAAALICGLAIPLERVGVVQKPAKV